jgi:hypothetical protein
MEDLRFPIGPFEYQGEANDAQRAAFIEEIAATPAQLRAALAGLNDEQLATPYRAEGWTVRQVVHHLADSHINSYIRFKLALTEDTPTIKAYDEAKWAELNDACQSPLAPSLTLLESLHERWVILLRGLTKADYARAFRHPERGLVTLDTNLAIYAWHGRHHIAHITALRKRLNWQ